MVRLHLALLSLSVIAPYSRAISSPSNLLELRDEANAPPKLPVPPLCVGCKKPEAQAGENTNTSNPSPSNKNQNSGNGAGKSGTNPNEGNPGGMKTNNSTSTKRDVYRRARSVGLQPVPPKSGILTGQDQDKLHPRYGVPDGSLNHVDTSGRTRQVQHAQGRAARRDVFPKQSGVISEANGAQNQVHGDLHKREDEYYRKKRHGHRHQHRKGRKHGNRHSDEHVHLHAHTHKHDD